MSNIEISREICSKMNSLDETELLKLENVIIKTLGEYDIQKKTTEVVLYNSDQDRRMYQKFFVVKKLEGLSQSTLKYYDTILKNILQKIQNPLVNISSDDIRYYLASKSGVVSNVTLNNERRVLLSFFNFLIEEEYLLKNPMLKIKAIKEQKEIKKPFGAEELERLRRKCRTARDKAILEIFYSTACRVSEVVNLNIADINLSSREARVLGKGNKERVVFLSVKCKLALEEYFNERAQTAELHGTDPVIASLKKPHNRLTKGAVETWFRKLGKEAGVDNVHPHRMRRTTATVALSKGMPISAIKDLLGHEDIKTTTIYAKNDVEEVRRNHEKFI